MWLYFRKLYLKCFSFFSFTICVAYYYRFSLLFFISSFILIWTNNLYNYKIIILDNILRFPQFHLINLKN